MSASTSTAATPAISVVVATYNRSATLAETLAHLERQTLAKDLYEVIVADDGSPDDTEDVVRDAATRLGFSIVYTRHENHGVGYTQNRGIERATAPLVLLIADDIFLSPGALAEHLARHERQPRQEIAVLGRVLQSKDADDSVFLSTWEPFQFQDMAYSDGQIVPYYMFWACNVSFKRDFMLMHGMFREHKGRAGYAAHEDVELGYRLHRHGMELVYSHDALGFHHHLTTLDAELKRAYSRGLNWGEFRRLAPAPELDVRYHVLNRSTLKTHVETFRSDRKQYLLGSDRSIAFLISLYVSRALLLNRLTVTAFWKPLLDAAEESQWVARLMHRKIYRGVIAHHFHRGCADALKKFGF
jgi:GT2 family glycosyltransferase